MLTLYAVPRQQGITGGKSGNFYVRKVNVIFFEAVMFHAVIQLELKRNSGEMEYRTHLRLAKVR